MMIRQVGNVFGGGSNGAISKDFGVFLRFKPLFCQSVPTNLAKVAEKVFFGVVQLPTKYQAKG